MEVHIVTASKQPSLDVATVMYDSRDAKIAFLETALPPLSLFAALHHSAFPAALSHEMALLIVG